MGNPKGHSGGDELDTAEAVAEALAGFDFEDPDDTLLSTPEETVGEEEGETPEGGEDEPVLVDEEEDASEQVEETEQSDETIIDVNPYAKLRLPDGTLVEANSAILMQADYTRKTQELAEQRKQVETERQQFELQARSMQNEFQQMQTWYQQRVSSPSSWIAEIASQSEDPTSTLAKALYDLATAGMLDEKFVETFGIETGDIAEAAKSSRIEDELAEVKAWKAQQEQERFRADKVKQQTQVYEEQWGQIKSSRTLAFDSPAEEYEAKRQLLMFALENNLGRSLIDAYDIMTVRQGPLVREKVVEPDPDVVNKKRASRAVTPKTAVTVAPAVKKNLSTRDAILEAMEGLTV